MSQIDQSSSAVVLNFVNEPLIGYHDPDNDLEKEASSRCSNLELKMKNQVPACRSNNEIPSWRTVSRNDPEPNNSQPEEALAVYEASRPVFKPDISQFVFLNTHTRYFDEYDTATRQLSNIIITPAQAKAHTVFCIRTATEFSERCLFNYIMYTGHKPPPVTESPFRKAVGFVQSLPSSWIFEVGNPTVTAPDEKVTKNLEQYACQSQVMKRIRLMHRFHSSVMRWEFKADLCAQGLLQKFAWLELRVEHKVVELELRERKSQKRILAVWRRGKSQDRHRGRLWLRRDFPDDVVVLRKQATERRWAVAVWLTLAGKFI